MSRAASEPALDERILTEHSQGKSGKNITKQNYETLKKAILSSLRNEELAHTELFQKLEKRLGPTFSGNTSWYGETVKLDLEAEASSRESVRDLRSCA